MRIDIITLFPEMCEAVLGESIIGRARKKGIVELVCHQLRDYAFDKHHRVDDSTYGGGMGMLMMAEPIALCFEDLCKTLETRPHFIYLSPKGATLTQEKVRSLAAYDNLALLCGHYEGVDQRVLDTYVDEEISIGDYVLTGGELPALVLADSVCRMIPGVLSDDLCFEEESHYSGLLEYPQYTKPAEWRGMTVPEVLLSGHHANIEQWRREQALLETARRRPDLFAKLVLDEKDKKFLRKKGII
ncbi:MAG: tRNA (guanosine(37)-N1)-methyltransferase TrmD [Acutalibacteraceae bacterium]|nr:tRNA (guanosine(37)-N1)-methyltransferase TrmD [Clostridia bacterium]MEE3403348.1 tRNA (guanosine(37)-N1)-methyltransferase TrmD [Acutalibacteraceae bacterium]HCA56199.1 tRNA (guanosine(37)-N1)-methyltransferase TrmD [Oscillospiraceae bacterium]